MKNLKNINHWIAELRNIAYNSALFDIDDVDLPMSDENKKIHFNKTRFKDAFDEGLTPLEAFYEEMQAWADAE